jgi:hypothetical protein
VLRVVLLLIFAVFFSVFPGRQNGGFEPQNSSWICIGAKCVDIRIIVDHKVIAIALLRRQEHHASSFIVIIPSRMM